LSVIGTELSIDCRASSELIKRGKGRRMALGQDQSGELGKNREFPKLEKHGKDPPQKKKGRGKKKRDDKTDRSKTIKNVVGGMGIGKLSRREEKTLTARDARLTNNPTIAKGSGLGPPSEWINFPESLDGNCQGSQKGRWGRPEKKNTARFRVYFPVTLPPPFPPLGRRVHFCIGPKDNLVKEEKKKKEVPERTKKGSYAKYGRRKDAQIKKLICKEVPGHCCKRGRP